MTLFFIFVRIPHVCEKEGANNMKKKKQNKICRHYNIDLLAEYAKFLQASLEEAGILLSNNGVMEITDVNFDTATDYLNRDNLSTSRVITMDYFDYFINEPDLMPDVNIIYSQLPFKNSDLLIRKLSLVPLQTHKLAVLGTYGLNSDTKKRENNFKILRQFVKLLENTGFDYEHFSKQTTENYFNLVISRQKIMTK